MDSIQRQHRCNLYGNDVQRADRGLSIIDSEFMNVCLCGYTGIIVSVSYHHGLEEQDTLTPVIGGGGVLVSDHESKFSVLQKRCSARPKQ